MLVFTCRCDMHLTHGYLQLSSNKEERTRSPTLPSLLRRWLSADCKVQTHPFAGSFSQESQLLKSQDLSPGYSVLFVSMAQDFSNTEYGVDPG
jgi:hypothetical protein